VLLGAEKVFIFTTVYNRPEFIEWQCKTFQKFLLDDYEFVVFNDASDTKISRQIEDVCKKHRIECIRVPQNHIDNSPGGRHQEAIHYSLNKKALAYDGIVCMIDSDMFQVQPFSIIAFMKDWDIAALAQSRANDVHYLFPGLVFMDMRTLPNKETMNWARGNINGSACDTGGQMHYYLKNNPNVRVNYLNQFFCYDNTYDNETLEKCGFDKYAIKFIQQRSLVNSEFLLSGHFFHYRAASWDFSIDQGAKVSRVGQYINEILAEDLKVINDRQKKRP
jgi:hypothetical protein